MNMKYRPFLACLRVSPLALLFIAILPGIAPTAPVQADSVRAFESPEKAENLKIGLEKVLEELNPNRFYADEETLGFTFLFRSKFLSPYSYSIFGGPISSRNPLAILRLEGGTGDVDMLARILEQKKIITREQAYPPEAQLAPLESKSHLVGQGLNLLAPWAGVLYSSYGSPRLSRGQTWFRALGFFTLDVFFVLGGGSNWFRESYQPGKYGTNIAIGLALTRMLGAYQQMDLIQGHNRVAELKYTFYLE